MGRRGASLSANRLLRQFEKTGGRGEYCCPFQDLSEVARHSLATSARLAPDEDPVLACFFSKDRWILLTTKRLVWKEGRDQHSVASAELTTATVPSDHLLDAGGKSAMTTLSIGTVEGRTYELHLEPGRPFFGFWNVLKLVAR
jgi:hypothetical protein